jgi:hypothetical protein
MNRSVTRPGELASLVACILRSHREPAVEREFVLRCQRIAAAYVRTKTAASSFDPSRLGLTASDFAFDAIGDLFRRDEAGRFPAFTAIFGTTPIEQRQPEEVERIVRHLVFTAVDRQIFRSYRESDPMLSKLLRNIKLTLRKHPTAELREVAGELVVVSRTAEIQESLPVLPLEMMEAELAARLPGSMDLREMLAVLAGVLADQEDHSRRYPVMGAAMIFRGFYSRTAEGEPETDSIDGMTDEELQRFLRPALGKVMRRTGRKYVEDGKISEQELEVYMRALSDMVLERFTRRESETMPLYAHVVRHDPTVTSDEYQTRHRTVLEYLLKLLHRELQELLQEEWDFLR